MRDYSQFLQNGLNILVDYIRFTVTASMSVDDVISFMGFDISLFDEMPKGANGYRHMKRCSLYNISVLYDGSEDMGIHVNISGGGIAPLLESYKNAISVSTPFGSGLEVSSWQETTLTRFLSAVLEIGHFTRLDIAIDDFGGNYYTPDEMVSLYDNNCIVSKWRNCKRVDERNAPGKICGSTVYFGSRESSLLLRVYDKKLEQNKSKITDDDNYINFDWIRWELEFKDKRATELAERLLDGVSLPAVAVGVLYYYIRVILPDDSNKSRCSTAPKWERFMNGIEKLRLCVPKHQKTIAEKELWVEAQVAPTLGTLLLLYGGDMDYLNDLALKNLRRISTCDKELIRKERPDIYNQYFYDIGGNDFDSQ